MIINPGEVRRLRRLLQARINDMNAAANAALAQQFREQGQAVARRILAMRDQAEQSIKATQAAFDNACQNIKGIFHLMATTVVGALVLKRQADTDRAIPRRGRAQQALRTQIEAVGLSLA